MKHKTFEALVCSLSLVQLNYVSEFSSRYAMSLGADCPWQYLAFKKIGVSWISCWLFSGMVAMALFFRSRDDNSKMSDISNVSILPIGICFISFMLILNHLMRSEIPMAGGVFDVEPSCLWDWVVIAAGALILLYYLVIRTPSNSAIQKKHAVRPQ
jgi:hypothetical protein